MVNSAKTPPTTSRDVLLILGPYPYEGRAVGWYDSMSEQWCECNTNEMLNGRFIEEDEDCYVAGWMEMPDVELWKDQLIGEYEWRRDHEETS